MATDNPDKCFCIEIFRKKYGNHVKGKCLKLDCDRYRREHNIITVRNDSPQNN